jgi:hypothetical protein
VLDVIDNVILPAQPPHAIRAEIPELTVRDRHDSHIVTIRD